MDYQWNYDGYDKELLLNFLLVVQVLAFMSANHLSIRLPAAEMKLLEQYCQNSQRTKTDVIRAFIRSLNEKL